MSKIDKIAGVIFLSLVLIIAFVLAMGFLIGGRFGIVHIICSAIFSLVCVLVFTKIIKKQIPKDNQGIFDVLCIAIVFFLAIWGTYIGINRLGASTEYTEIETVVTRTYYNVPRTIISDEIYFYDGENEVKWDDIRLISDDEHDLGVGSNITMRKRDGLFGYPVYSLVSVNSDATE